MVGPETPYFLRERRLIPPVVNGCQHDENTALSFTHSLDIATRQVAERSFWSVPESMDSVPGVLGSDKSQKPK